MAWTQADVDALKASIKSGVKSVAYSDRNVVYQTVDEMLRVLAAMEAEVANVGGNAQASDGRSTLATYSRD